MNIIYVWFKIVIVFFKIVDIFVCSAYMSIYHFQLIDRD